MKRTFQNYIIEHNHFKTLAQQVVDIYQLADVLKNYRHTSWVFTEFRACAEDLGQVISIVVTTFAGGEDQHDSFVVPMDLFDEDRIITMRERAAILAKIQKEIDVKAAADLDLANRDSELAAEREKTRQLLIKHPDLRNLYE
jgi:hypothetical protein